MGTLASYKFPLSLGFLVCKTGMIRIAPSWGFGENEELRHVCCLAECWHSVSTQVLALVRTAYEMMIEVKC